MKILLFNDEKYNDLHLQFKELTKSNILITEQVETHRLSQDDYLMQVIFDLENKHIEFDSFLIPVSIGNVHTEYLGLKLGLLIRLSFEIEAICTKPIIFISTESIADLIKYSSYSSVFNFSEIHLCTFNEFEIEERISLLKRTSINKIASELDKVKIEQPIETSRHSLANEWALYRLADVFNILYKIEEYKNFRSIINTPYFRLLLNKVHYNKSKGIKKIFSSLQTCEKGKFLLIDDKADSGWAQVLEFLLKKMNHENELDSIQEIKKNLNCDLDYEPILKIISEKKYDLIFLDLRLLEEENYLSLNTLQSIEEFSGALVLNKIKDQDPSLPVIMFTASQQAWNFVQLLELGADGYFIKESPDNIFSDNILIQNITGLSIEIANLTKRGKILSWFYQNSVKIKNHIDQLTWNENVKLRVKEKLDIGFSLLLGKRTEFDKQFLYTDYELAFLVYWSCLNEIQSEMIGYYDGRSTTLTLPSSSIKIIDNSTTTVSKVSISSTGKFHLRFPHYNSMKKITLNSAPIPLDIVKDGYHLKQLSFLIPAYILIKYGSNFQKFVDEFIILSEIRNHLDFTHSSEYEIKNYSIAGNRNELQAIEDCRDMFRFIYFLLTETELK